MIRSSDDNNTMRVPPREALTSDPNQFDLEFSIYRLFKTGRKKACLIEDRRRFNLLGMSMNTEMVQ